MQMRIETQQMLICLFGKRLREGLVLRLQGIISKQENTKYK